MNKATYSYLHRIIRMKEKGIDYPVIDSLISLREFIKVRNLIQEYDPLSYKSGKWLKMSIQLKICILRSNLKSKRQVRQVFRLCDIR